MINKIPVKKLVEFRRLSERSQSTFAKNLQKPKKPKSDDDTNGGGNYWVRSISGLRNAFKHNDSKLIQEKIDEVMDKYTSTNVESTKVMYKRNLEILHNYTEFDFSIWRPAAILKFPTKSNLILSVKDLPIQVIPNHIFSYEDKGKPTMGGIWFVIWIEGFKKGDLGIYADVLFKYLSFVYSKKYNIDPKYCLIVDALSKDVVTYNQILEGSVPSLLNPTVDALNKYLH